MLDAAAVDTRRRLVLIRRDDVEHLILIGGPTDVVIESRIATTPATPADEMPRPAAAADARLDDRPVERRAAAAGERQPGTPQAGQTMPQPRPIPAQPVDPTISNAAAALYGEQANVAPRPVAMPADRRPAAAATPDSAPRQTARPEDVLEAARLRVMPQVAQPVAAQPVADARAAAQPARAAAPPSSDFERLLDAEISGNLQKIAPDPAARQQPAQTVRAEGTGQPRPVPTQAAPANGDRREPSLEEEMFRLLEERDNQRR